MRYSHFKHSSRCLRIKIIAFALSCDDIEFIFFIVSVRPYRLSKNHWRQVIRKQSLYSDTRLIITTRVISRRRVWSLRLNISTTPRFKGQSSRPSCTVMTKTRSSKPAPWHHCRAKMQGSKPASRHHCNLKTRSLKPASGRVRNLRVARFGVSIQNAWLKARVLTTEKLCVSVITALITGSITVHVMRGVNPHHWGFLGDSFIPETLINSLVCKGSEVLVKKDWNWLGKYWQLAWPQVSLKFYWTGAMLLCP